MVNGMQKKDEGREFYIDYLRLGLIVLVVMQHLSVTYSGIGSWYYLERGALSLPETTCFLLFNSFNQAYFMGLLFLVAGYFVPGAYDKKGFWRFNRDRLFRLGVPALFYMLAIHPLIVYGMGVAEVRPRVEFLPYYTDYISHGQFLSGSGPLWFAVALLFFCFVYSLLRLAGGKVAKSMQAELPTTGRILAVWLLIALVAFSIRLVQPIGTSIFNMQLCFFSEYVFLFAAGIAAQRRRWFTLLRYEYGVKWLKAVLLIGMPCWFFIMIAGGVITTQAGFEALCGGWHWQAAAYALLESFIGVGMSIGLLAVFREKCNQKNKSWLLLADNSFAVYMFHAPIIVALAISLRGLAWLLLLKFLLLSIISLPICFAATHFIFRRLPLVKKMV
ncbi:MAG TPA: acyltransferase family protein [Patescibacteria group bacterium]|nr:acyltransferase family protein [Patescibacteria group bacterium]